jgi:hypothetical protein
MRDVSDNTMTATAPRYTRRLSDKILIAFHQACDQADFEVAERLLKVLESMIAAQRRASALRGSERRRDQDTLIAAHERLWQLRHPNEDWTWCRGERTYSITALAACYDGKQTVAAWCDSCGAPAAGSL